MSDLKTVGKEPSGNSNYPIDNGDRMFEIGAIAENIAMRLFNSELLEPGKTYDWFLANDTEYTSMIVGEGANTLFEVRYIKKLLASKLKATVPNYQEDARQDIENLEI